MAGNTATAVHPGRRCQVGHEDGSCPLYGTGAVANCMPDGTRWRCTHRLVAAPQRTAPRRSKASRRK